jgi:hypothetical protein
MMVNPVGMGNDYRIRIQNFSWTLILFLKGKKSIMAKNVPKFSLMCIYSCFGTEPRASLFWEKFCSGSFQSRVRIVPYRPSFDFCVQFYYFFPVLRIRIRIRIHRIHIFLGLLVPNPDPLVRGMDPDPDPDPSVIKQI